MKINSVSTLCVLTTLWMVLASAKEPAIETGVNNLSGVYGTSSVALQLNDDGTYKFTHDCYRIEATGNWELKGKTVRLLGVNGRVDHLPTRWKLASDAPCLRSEMKNWEVLRLCQN